MLLYRKQLWQNPVGVKLQVSVLQFYYNSTPPWVFSSKFILELPWTTASVLPLFFPGYFPHICLRKVSLFYSRKPKILVPFIQVFLLRANIMVPFFINTKVLLILFQKYFFSTLYVGRTTEETYLLPLK